MANKSIALSLTFLVLLFFSFFTFRSHNQEMHKTSTSEMYAFRLKPGSDLKEELQRIVASKGWKAVGIVTCVGSLNEAHLRFANQPLGTKINGKLEIVSLTGTLSETNCHIHMSVSDSTGKTTGGHLLEGNKIYTTAEIVLVILKDYQFERKIDPAYGYKELEVKSLKTGKD